MRKVLFIMTLLLALTACGTSETVSREELQTMQQTLNAQATQLAQLALLMATPTPTFTPTNTPVPTSTPTTSQPAPACLVIHDYQLKDLTEVSTSKDGFLHVEFWVGGDAPEYETILPGGRYLLKIQFSGGHVWEYAGCTFEQVKNQVDAHISRRLAQKAKNGGYVEWGSTEYFIPVR